MNNPPKYRSNESINSYINKAETYLMKLQETKYDIVLNFINEWLNVNLKSLTDLKFIGEHKLLKDREHNILIIKKYVPLFNDMFAIELNINDDTEDEQIGDEYIIDLLKYMVKLLELQYKVVAINKNGKIYYTIKKL